MQFDTTNNYLLAQSHANNCNFINPYPEFADPGDVARQRLTKIAEEVVANASAFKSQPYSESQHDAAVAT